MEPLMLFAILTMGVFVLFYWRENKTLNVKKTDESSNTARDIVENTFDAETEDIDQAVASDNAEDQLADMINRRGGPL
tara:strand:- start:1447 stop:1680 length:234 start_codon:yes stop_codon:yes gene_type:complete